MDVLINWKTDFYEKLLGHNFWFFFLLPNDKRNVKFKSTLTCWFW